MSINDKIKTYLGFAVRGNKILLGSFAVENSLKTQKAKLIIMAQDMNPKRQEILRKWCEDIHVEFLALGTKEEFGILLNKKPLGLMSIIDEGLAKAIMKEAKSCGGD